MFGTRTMALNALRSNTGLFSSRQLSRSTALGQYGLRKQRIQPNTSSLGLRHRLPNQTIFSRLASTTASFEHDEDSDRKPRQPPRWFQRPIVLLLAFMPVFTFTLGVWQIKRLQWKLELIDELESKLKKEPLSLPKNIE